jgi:exonuclease III
MFKQQKKIPGYHPFIFKQREMEEWVFTLKKALTLLLSHPSNFKLYVTCLYRYNGTLPNISQVEQKNRFDTHFENLLSHLSTKTQKTFIFSDSNIDLMHCSKKT